MTMLHCYWQYTEATQNHSQTSWLKNQTIIPIKLGQFSATSLNPSIAMSQPIQVTEPATDSHEPNSSASNSIVETLEPIEVTKTSKVLTELNVTILEPNGNAETEPNTATEISVPVTKPTLSSTEPSVGALNSNAEIRQPREITEPGANSTELSDALTDHSTPIQKPNSAMVESIGETHEFIEAMEPGPESEPDKNTPENNVTLTEPNERLQEYSMSTSEPKEEKQ